jgi:hypothetical protein
MSIRVAGIAILAAELMAFLAERPRVFGVWVILLVVQFAALMWSTSVRSAEALRLGMPAALAGVTGAAVWTALAFGAPSITKSDTWALLTIAACGLTVAAWPPRRTLRQLRPLVLTAGAVASLLIFLAIQVVLPTFSGFIANNHDPVYTDVTRMVDPILEFAISVLLVLALGIEALLRRAQNRAAPFYGTDHVAGPNEMVVLPDRAE